MHDPNPFPFTEYVATMRVNSLGEGNSEFEWSAEFKVQGMADENSGSVRLPPDDVNGVIRRDQCVAGHAAPGGQVYGSPTVVSDDLKPVPGFHLVHTETELDDW
jgi:hypothetical protein